MTCAIVMCALTSKESWHSHVDCINVTYSGLTLTWDKLRAIETMYRVLDKKFFCNRWSLWIWNKWSSCRCIMSNLGPVESDWVDAVFYGLSWDMTHNRSYRVLSKWICICIERLISWCISPHQHHSTLKRCKESEESCTKWNRSWIVDWTDLSPLSSDGSSMYPFLAMVRCIG